MNKRALFIVVIMVLLLCFGGCAKEKTTNFTSRGSLQHDFPKPLLDFEAKSRGVDAIDLTTAETLRVFVSCSLYVEPEQVFHDPEIIAAVAKALESIEVTDVHDGVNYEDCGATVYGFYFEKADGERIAHFSFQHDENLMLAETEGRYPVTGYADLFSVEGIKLSPDDWKDRDNDGSTEEGPVPVADPLPEPIPQPDEALRGPLPIPGLSELICTKTAGYGGDATFEALFDADGDGAEEAIIFTSFYTVGDEEPSCSGICIKEDRKIFSYEPRYTALTSPFHAYVYEDQDGAALLIWTFYALSGGEPTVAFARLTDAGAEIAELPWDGIDGCKDRVFIRGNQLCAVEELIFQTVNQY